MTYVASDIMQKDVICVRKDTDLRDLGKLFLSRKITGCPVIDPEGDLCGVISQTDLLYYQLSRDDELVVPSDFYQSARVDGRPIATGFQIEDVNTATVEEVMTPIVHAVSGTTPVDEIARLMTRRHIHRVIVREGKKVAGIISALDLLRVIDSPNGAKAPAKRRAAVKRAKPKARKGAKARSGRSRRSRAA